MYSVVEGENRADVCTSVASGDIAGRTFSINYQTEDGDAQGKLEHTHNTCVLNLFYVCI